MPRIASRRMASDVAFSPVVKNLQSQCGSRASYAAMELNGGWRTTVTPDLTAILARTNSFYLATASAEGQPYIQHRGGPAGFLRVIDAHTLGFADFRGNRQYISQGNLSENARIFLFLMDYRNRRRIKLWGRARVVENDPALLARLMPADYRARADQVILIDIEAWDTNCPQHIPELVPATELTALQDRIAALEAELVAVRAASCHTAA